MKELIFVYTVIPKRKPFISLFVDPMDKTHVQVVDWIYKVIGEAKPSEDPHQALKNGVALCKLLNKTIGEGTVPRINTLVRVSFSYLIMKMPHIRSMLMKRRDVDICNYVHFHTS